MLFKTRKIGYPLYVYVCTHGCAVRVCVDVFTDCGVNYNLAQSP